MAFKLVDNNQLRSVITAMSSHVAIVILSVNNCLHFMVYISCCSCCDSWRGICRCFARAVDLMPRNPYIYSVSRTPFIRHTALTLMHPFINNVMHSQPAVVFGQVKGSNLKAHFVVMHRIL